jgi:quercetin dioxygenase-like cupin family protein
MNALINTPLHISSDQMLNRSRWFGPNLVTILAKSTETNGVFSLVRCVLRKVFEPPLHVHSKEDESYFILDGEICYEAGDQRMYAKSGDYVHLPRNVPHTFKLITDIVTLLLFITPAGFEDMFVQCSRPALSFDLPPIPTEPPGAAFFATMARVNAELDVTFLPDL